jgi:hypothetical protein
MSKVKYEQVKDLVHSLNMELITTKKNYKPGSSVIVKQKVDEDITYTRNLTYEYMKAMKDYLKPDSIECYCHLCERIFIEDILKHQ